MSDILSGLQKLSKRYPVFNPINYLVNIYWKKRHHRMARSFYSQFIKKGELCFDIGANLGNRTQIFYELGARTISVEPQEMCIKHLRRQFGNNPNVIIVPKALAEKEGTAMLAICEESPILSTMSEKWKIEGRFAQSFNWSKTLEVPTTTLDALIEQFGIPVFCKVDVEGFEEKVLLGLSQPIQIISFEFTYEFMNDAIKCIDHLNSLGAVTFNYSLGERMSLNLHSWVSSEELISILKTYNNSSLWGDIYSRFE